jgi:glycosyltransferase involved in cell wall biosynthesis
VRKHKISIVHSHGFGAGLYSRSLKLLGAKVIHTFHGLHFNKGLRNQLKTHFEWVLKFFTDIHVTVSASESRKAQKLHIESQTIPNGLSKEQLKKQKKNLNWPPQTIGCLSRLDPHKNVSQVIEIFHHWKKKHPELKLLIAGDGEQKNELIEKTKHEKLQNDVEFLGFQKTYEFFDQVDLLVSASRGEGLPYTIMEAMAYGLPILISDVDGHKDLAKKECLYSLSSRPELPHSAPLSTLPPVFLLENTMLEFKSLYASINKN